MIIQTILVIGAGPWGMAVAHLLHRKQTNVIVYTKRQSFADEFNQTHTFEEVKFDGLI